MTKLQTNYKKILKVLDSGFSKDVTKQRVSKIKEQLTKKEWDCIERKLQKLLKKMDKKTKRETDIWKLLLYYKNETVMFICDKKTMLKTIKSLIK